MVHKSKRLSSFNQWLRFYSLSEFIHWRALRQHDEPLMERISKLDGVSRADLASFNRCRLYLGVNFLSEISSADG
jgi:hypothetical protein